MLTGEITSMFSELTLATAEILYRMPDHQRIIQTYVWQDYDFVPELPKLRSFLEFWKNKLDGPIVGVTVSHQGVVRPVDFVIARSVTTIN